jgi:hypothetical protein
MKLLGDDLRAAYYVTTEVVRSRQRSGVPIPDWMKRHYALLNTAILDESRMRHPIVENGPAGTQSAHGEIIGTCEVAAMLNLTPRQVQRQAGHLGGVRVCGRLLFMRADIAEHAERRRYGGSATRS